MNRRGFFKGILGLLGIKCLNKESVKWLKTEEVVPLSELGMTIGSSSNNVYMNYIKYWDEDEPDIYTLNDGVPV